MTKKELELLRHVLEEVESVDDGSGHWVPDIFFRDLSKAIEIVEKELRDLHSKNHKGI